MVEFGACCKNPPLLRVPKQAAHIEKVTCLTLPSPAGFSRRRWAIRTSPGSARTRACTSSSRSACKASRSCSTCWSRTRRRGRLCCGNEQRVITRVSLWLIRVFLVRVPFGELSLRERTKAPHQLPCLAQPWAAAVTLKSTAFNELVFWRRICLRPNCVLLRGEADKEVRPNSLMALASLPILGSSCDDDAVDYSAHLRLHAHLGAFGC